MSDTEARDRLARILWESEYLPRAMLADCEAIADEILTAGFRPPARTVTTVKELDALPDGTVIRNSEREVAERIRGLWHYTDPYGLGRLALPATVLCEPKEDQ